ncbi:adipocyte plasma membrane-associated protein isoform X1 [Drosophila serrata]|uniref:adipocyte plasma membrane-associated protein isoform X1 n=1 Tax=Drosophila serrata TaxID=7274 RepID=UPI000A1D303D|nr:adipocyte plasma membrane-associated protein isoform X1 [Drosophila serrata]
MGFLSSIRKVILYVGFFLGAIFLLPGLPPNTTFPLREYVITPPRELKGTLEANTHLDGARHLWQDRVFGPECLIARDDGIYTGIHGGEVIRLKKKDYVETVTKIGKPCNYIFQDTVCGYPVGLAFVPQKNNMIIADAYYGLWEVNLDTNQKTMLVSPEQVLPGKKVNRPAKLFNSVAISREGDIYWTDSLTDDFMLAPFANPSGRLFRYNRKMKTNEVLLDELAFANGLVLSPKEDFIIVSETTAMRLTKYHLKGPRAGQSEVFVDGLPGLPDNLTPDAEGIWVPLGVAADSENPNMFAILSPHPRLRFFLARLMALMQLPFRYLNQVYPNTVVDRLFHLFTEWVSRNTPSRTTVVRVDWNGNIVRSLHGFDRSSAGISHVLEFEGHLYMGSPFNPYVIQVELPITYEKENEVVS